MCDISFDEVTSTIWDIAPGGRGAGSVGFGARPAGDEAGAEVGAAAGAAYRFACVCMSEASCASTCHVAARHAASRDLVAKSRCAISA